MGLGLYGQDRARARTQAPAASFVVAGDPRAAPRFLAYMFGSEVANLVNFHEVDLAGAARLGVSARLPGYRKSQLAR